MSSDSSEEDERLMEAIDHSVINDSMFQKGASNNNTSTKDEKPASLRKSKEEDEQFNLFRTTPEFRHHVAKKLSQNLDKELENTIINNHDTVAKKYKQTNRIRLLKNSDCFIKNNVPVTEVIYKKKLNPTVDYDEDQELEKCKSVAVSPSHILSKTDTKHWSTRSKAPVFHYTKTARGLLSVDQ